MSTAPEPKSPEIRVVATPATDEPPLPPFLSEDDKQALRETMLLEIDSNFHNYFFSFVERTRLDPFTGQLAVRMQRYEDELPDGTKVWKKKPLFLTTLQGLRSIADRTGLYDGRDELLWCDADGVWTSEWLKEQPPYASKCTGYRKDWRHSVTSFVRWKSYAQSTWDTKTNKHRPTKFWDKYDYHMLGKCAQAGMMRELFPNALGNVFIREEIQEENPDVADAAEYVARQKESQTKTEAMVAEGATKVEEKPSAPVNPMDAVQAPPKPPVPPPEPTSEDREISEYVLPSPKELKGKKLGELSGEQLTKLLSVSLPVLEELHAAGKLGKPDLAKMRLTLLALLASPMGAPFRPKPAAAPATQPPAQAPEKPAEEPEIPY